MYFPHNESIVTFNQLEFTDPSPYPTRDQVFPLFILSVSIDSAPPRVTYVASYSSCPIVSEKKPLCSCFPSWDSVPKVDQVIYPIHTVEPSLLPIDPFECLDMCPICDGLLPSDEVFL